MERIIYYLFTSRVWPINLLSFRDGIKANIKLTFWVSMWKSSEDECSPALRLTPGGDPRADTGHYQFTQRRPEETTWPKPRVSNAAVDS